MVDKPNSSFINYLKNFGPWVGSSNQQAENRSLRKTAKGIAPFDFAIAGQDKFKSKLQELIESKQSQVIFICGQAGDGKTHFLRKIFSDPKLLAQTEDDWDRFSSEVVFSVSSHDVTFTIVKDLSEISAHNELALEQIFKPVATIIGAAIARNRASASSYSAANYVDVASQETDRTGSISAGAGETGGCQIVLIAANNGRILEQFSNQSKKFALDQGLIAKLESYMLYGKHYEALKEHDITCFDIASCINAPLITSIFRQIVERPEWSECSNCNHAKLCPVWRNRNLILNNQLFYTRIEELFELLIDDGAHYTIRNLILLVANTILGREHSDKKKSYYTCTCAKNTCAKAVKSPEALTNEALSPYDNFFGQAFVTKQKNTADTPIFRQLEPLAVGQHTNKLIDNFILSGTNYCELNLTEQYQRLLVQPDQFAYLSSLNAIYDQLLDEDKVSSANSGSKSADKNYQATLAQLHLRLLSVRRMLFFTMGESDKLFNPYALTAYQFAPQYLKLKALIQEQHDLLSGPNSSDDNISLVLNGLNRCFTSLMVLDKEDQLVVTSNNKLYPTEFCILYDKHYELRYFAPNDVLVNRVKLVNGALVNDVKDSMCLAFFGAIDHSELDQQIEICMREKAKVDHEFNLAFENGNHELARKLKEQLALVSDKLDKLKDSKGEASKVGKVVTYLKITPKIFDYLLSLASGQMSISFSDECIKEIMTFKSALENYLVMGNKEQSATYQHSTIQEQLAHIQFCSIDQQGRISH